MNLRRTLAMARKELIHILRDTRSLGIVVVMPVTLPDPSSEILVLVVLHAPPATKSLSEIVKPVHTVDAPPIPDGAGFTVTCAIAVQPNPVVYVIVAVPPMTPVTIPEETPTVAIEVLPLDHVPEPSVSAVVAPAQTASAPVIGAGAGLIDTVTVREQPVGMV